MRRRKIWWTTSGLCLRCRVVPPQEGDRQASDHQHRCYFLPGKASSQQKEEQHILGPWWRSLQFYMLSPEGCCRSNTRNPYYLELTTNRTSRTNHDWLLNLTWIFQSDLNKQGSSLCFCPKVSWSCPCPKLSWCQAATSSGYPGWSSHKIFDHGVKHNSEVEALMNSLILILTITPWQRPQGCGVEFVSVGLDDYERDRRTDRDAWRQDNTFLIKELYNHSLRILGKGATR